MCSRKYIKRKGHRGQQRLSSSFPSDSLQNLIMTTQHLRQPLSPTTITTTTLPPLPPHPPPPHRQQEQEHEQGEEKQKDKRQFKEQGRTKTRKTPRSSSSSPSCPSPSFPSPKAKILEELEYWDTCLNAVSTDLENAHPNPERLETPTNTTEFEETLNVWEATISDCQSRYRSIEKEFKLRSITWPITK